MSRIDFFQAFFNLVNIRLRGSNKGMSQVLAIIVAAMVLMVAAIGVIFVFQSGFDDFGGWVGDNIEDPCDYASGSDEVDEDDC